HLLACDFRSRHGHRELAFGTRYLDRPEGSTAPLRAPSKPPFPYAFRHRGFQVGSIKEVVAQAAWRRAVGTAVANSSDIDSDIYASLWRLQSPPGRAFKKSNQRKFH